MNRLAGLLIFMLTSVLAHAELPGILHWESGENLETVYQKVYKSLEKNRFYIVFEPDIGRNLAGFAERWGEDYNRSGLSGIRSMVFCNARYTNQISNLDPTLLALCPLHLTLYHQNETTHVIFLRPTYAGSGSQAAALLQELEAEVSAAVAQGLAADKAPGSPD